MVARLAPLSKVEKLIDALWILLVQCCLYKITRMMSMHKFKLETALLPDGWARDVVVDVDAAGVISAVTPDSQDGVDANIAGAAIPAVPNVHSHAHQRAMIGLAERSGPGTDSFWTWREAMYGFAHAMEPEDLEAVAAQLYVETLKSGSTVIGEFQYLHHQRDGTSYYEPAEMSLRCLQAARRAGIAITMLPTLYAHGGFGGQRPGESQRRFVNGADSFLRIIEALAKACEGRPLERVGMSPHSLRAVTAELLVEVLQGLDAMVANAPVHIHVAEQIKEVEDCLSWCGRRPVQYLLEHLPVSTRWCAIHATHMTGTEIAALAASGAVAGLCPTTEANLGDGTFPAPSYLAQNGAIAIGSDSHITVSPAEDLRQLEYSQRLLYRARTVLAGGPHRSNGRRLFDAVLAGGAQAMNHPVGAIAPGRRCDIAVLDTDHPALYGRSGDEILDAWIFSAGNSAVRHVLVAGEAVVSDGRHRGEEEVGTAFCAAIDRLKRRKG
jgi:formimidoylglutamate deiminase